MASVTTPGGEVITPAGDATASDPDLAALMQAAQTLRDRGYNLGVLLFDADDFASALATELAAVATTDINGKATPFEGADADAVLVAARKYTDEALRIARDQHKRAWLADPDNYVNGEPDYALSGYSPPSDSALEPRIQPPGTVTPTLADALTARIAAIKSDIAYAAVMRKIASGSISAMSKSDLQTLLEGYGMTVVT